MPPTERRSDRPALLVVRPLPERCQAFLDFLEKHDDGRLQNEFDVVCLDCYDALQGWYRRNNSRFVAGVVLDLDFTGCTETGKLLGYPEIRAPVPRRFDPLANQGFLVYAGLRQNNLDRIAPVVIVAPPGRLASTQQYADLVVYPGYGICSFVEERSDDPIDGCADVVRELEHAVLRPLTGEGRAHWRDHHRMVVGRSRRMAYLAREIERIGPAGSIALLLGQPGVGKELVAQALHRCSRRHEANHAGRDLPVTVNIAAIEENLVENELFGHERGAYTGADSQRRGVFETAGGSSVFLDEIGDIQPEVQIRLLRAIEYGLIRRLGGSNELKVDVRIIAATNRPVQELRTRFRQDFYGRIIQDCIPVPSLRERWENEPARTVEADLHEMFTFVAEDYCRRSTDAAHGELGIEDPALGFLHQLVRDYVAGETTTFQGNIRTLRSIFERACERALHESSTEVRLGHVISTMGLVQLMNADIAAQPNTTLEQLVGSLDMKSIERHAIVEALQRCRGNQSQAAELLGVHRDTLRRKINEYEIR